jgi:MFS transporter, AAHS family, 4-hydroxybenzoate transporter
MTKHKNKTSLNALFGQGLKKSTFMLWLSFFLSFTALYYLTSWIPKLATNAGLSVKLSIYAGLVFNAGAFLGIITQGALSAKWGLHKVIFFFLIGTGIVMTVFGLFAGSAWVLILFGFIGFGIQGGFIGLYAVAASIYPTEIRSTGIGWAIGFGRLGAIIGPLLGGLLMGAGLSMSQNFIIFSVPVFLAGIMTLFISAHK